MFKLTMLLLTCLTDVKQDSIIVFQGHFGVKFVRMPFSTSHMYYLYIRLNQTFFYKCLFVTVHAKVLVWIFGILRFFFMAL